MLNRFRSKRTTYAGVSMRSVLEASWAEFFIAAGIEYRYEVSRFHLGELSYLPMNCGMVLTMYIHVDRISV